MYPPISVRVPRLCADGPQFVAWIPAGPAKYKPTKSKPSNVPLTTSVAHLPCMSKPTQMPLASLQVQMPHHPPIGPLPTRWRTRQGALQTARLLYHVLWVLLLRPMCGCGREQRQCLASLSAACWLSTSTLPAQSPLLLSFCRNCLCCALIFSAHHTQCTHHQPKTTRRMPVQSFFPRYVLQWYPFQDGLSAAGLLVDSALCQACEMPSSLVSDDSPSPSKAESSLWCVLFVQDPTCLSKVEQCFQNTCCRCAKATFNTRSGHKFAFLCVPRDKPYILFWWHGDRGALSSGHWAREGCCSGLWNWRRAYEGLLCTMQGIPKACGAPSSTTSAIHHCTP